MRVLFLGEDSIVAAGRYLAAILKWSGIRFDHRPDQGPIPQAWESRKYDVFILSDYRYKSFERWSRRWLDKQVRAGAGLLMIGGWASFAGLVGGYAGTDIEDLLPVSCTPGDDRVNHPAALLPLGVVVCGYNRARPKPGTQTILHFRDLSFKLGRPALGSHHPALVTGRAGLGRTAAFLTDCAPHWAGGLVDWGRKRATVRPAPGVSVEVGEDYLRFFKKLITGLVA